ncbi:hypothetical protein BD410DRAFT_443930 [Rickenella mellea]|uniref:Uncharacterized protein n=1 Tax=Rickenella mellea TaxID=50990 RepID=A0A4Y7PW73_9AGAM|nr:hypothetical protein BD410DRAFT_443930 [Rickenella mellea]
MSGRSKAAEAAAASKIRLVLCECEKCKAADPEGKGRMVRQWEKTEHEKAQAIAQAASKSITSIRGRGRGRGSAASGSRRPGTVGFRGRGRAAYLAAPFSSSSGSHTLVGLPQAVNPSVQENDIHQPSELPRPIFEPVPEAAGIQHHLGHHVSFRACNILLFCLNAIFLFLNLITIDNQMPVNLGTVLKKLELGDRFVVYPICHLCHRIFRPDIPTTAVCPDCDSALFKVSSSTVFERIKRRPAPAPTPVCAAPIQVLSSLLVDFLSQPRNEDALEEWKTRTHEPGKYKDIMDGNIWRSMKCPDGSLFFDPSDDSGELRLGVTLSLDWFGRKTSVYGPSHSSGALSFSVSNLPPALRYRAANLLLAAMTPGPTEPSAEQLQHYLKIIVDDLIKLYETGISIKTASRPEGRPIRVVLLGVIAPPANLLAPPASRFLPPPYRPILASHTCAIIPPSSCT